MPPAPEVTNLWRSCIICIMAKLVKLEERAGRKRRNKNIQKMILETVAVAGLLSVALVAPNVLGAMRKMNLPLTPRQDTAIARARKRLVEKGLLRYEQNKLRLTEKGSAALARLDLAAYGQKKKKQRWDKRWRLLIFDIPEKRRGTREKIRRTLISIGFMRLQDSVWIYPYDCEDLIMLLKSEFRIGKDMLYAIIEELEYDTPVREYFDLLKN